MPKKLDYKIQYLEEEKKDIFNFSELSESILFQNVEFNSILALVQLSQSSSDSFISLDMAYIVHSHRTK